MIRTKLRALIGVAALWAVSHIACDSGTEYPCGPFDTSFDVLGYMVPLTYRTYGTVPLDTTMTVRFDSLAIQLSPVILNLPAEAANQSLGGVQRAYACTPPIPYSIDSLQDVFVVTEADYDSTFAAGDTLNPVLTISFIDERYGSSRMPLTEFLALRPSVKRMMYLELDVPPDHLAEYRFTVSLKHVNGEEFRYVTPSVTIRP